MGIEGLFHGVGSGSAHQIVGRCRRASTHGRVLVCRTHGRENRARYRIRSCYERPCALYNSWPSRASPSSRATQRSSASRARHARPRRIARMTCNACSPSVSDPRLPAPRRDRHRLPLPRRQCPWLLLPRPPLPWRPPLQRPHLPQYTVDTVADTQELRFRFKVNVRRTAQGCIGKQRIHEPNDRVAVAFGGLDQASHVNRAGFQLVQNSVNRKFMAIELLDSRQNLGGTGEPPNWPRPTSQHCGNLVHRNDIVRVCTGDHQFTGACIQAGRK